jgi:hypothetical protein
MYSGWQRGKAPSNEWINQSTEFLNHAFAFPGVAQNGTIKCPCAKCRNYFRHPRNTIELHLCRHGFKEDYETWTEHGEGVVSHYQVAPHGCVPLNTDNIESMSSEGPIHDVYQEEGLDGTFVIDLGDALDTIISLGSDEITDPKDLETIEKAAVEDEGYDEEDIEEEYESTEEEEEPMDEEAEETYDPNDF